jgi:Domain of unknown function DUF29
MGNRQLYDQDFFAWANEQAALLRDGRLSEADIDHIAEEIEAMGKSEKRELVSRLTVLLLHLLKWQHQPAFRSTSWGLTLEEQRNRLDDHLADNPSLKSGFGEIIVAAYRNAVLGAARETGKDRSEFRVVCPWSFDQIINPNFYPEETN